MKDKIKLNVNPLPNENNASFVHSEKIIKAQSEVRDQSNIIENTSKIMPDNYLKVQPLSVYKTKDTYSNKQFPNEQESKKLQFLNASDLKEDMQKKQEFESEIINPGKTILKLMVNLLKNQEELSNEFRVFLNIISKSNGFVNIEDFEVFLRNIRLNLSEKEISVLIKIFDYENQKKFPGSDFGESYKAFILLEEKLNVKMQEFCNAFEAVLSKSKLTIENFEKELIKRSDFGYISKKTLQNFLINELKINEETLKKLEFYFSMEGLVYVSGFIDKLFAILSKKSIVDRLDASILGFETLDKILSFFSKNNTLKHELHSILTQRKESADSRDFLGIREIIMIFKLTTYDLSFFEAFLLIIALNQSRSQNKSLLIYDHKIEADYLCGFFLEKIENIKEEMILSPIQKKPKLEDNDFDEINDLNSLLNEKKIQTNLNEIQKTTENDEENFQNQNLSKNQKESILQKETEKIKTKTWNNPTKEKLNEKVLLNEKEEKPIDEVLITSFQHQMKLKCYWLENLDLSKTNDGKPFSLRFCFVLHFLFNFFKKKV